MAIKKIYTCPWPKDDALMIAYHDEEWGVPLHDDQRLFEFIVLDAFQAGLSWSIILKKREAMRKAFSGFDPEKIARYNNKKIASLLADEKIIRNRQKIFATVGNARAFVEIQEKHGSFDRYIWDFVDGKPLLNKRKSLSDLPSRTEVSDVMSAELKKLGFSFVGSTICYAFMQAAGLVNDHLVRCFRYKEVQQR
jgi:DNA-3-methyladenine glycosylase I